MSKRDREIERASEHLFNTCDLLVLGFTTMCMCRCVEYKFVCICGSYLFKYPKYMKIDVIGMLDASMRFRAEPQS